MKGGAWPLAIGVLLLAAGSTQVSASAASDALTDAKALAMRTRFDPAAVPALRASLAGLPAAEATLLVHFLITEEIAEARPALAPALASDDEQLARAALDAVEALGLDDREQLEAVRALLVHGESGVRLRALSVLTGLGDDAVVPDIMDLLDDPDPAVASRAARSLRELTRHDAGDTATSWREWFHEADARARRELAEIRPAIDAGPGPAEALDIARRLVVLRAHGHLAAEELALLLDSPDPEVVRVARTALRDLGVPEATLALREAEPPPPRARSAAPAAAPTAQATEEPEDSWRKPVFGTLGVVAGVALLLWLFVPRRGERPPPEPDPDQPTRRYIFTR